MSKPLYPHVAKSRNAEPRLPQDELRFLPDSPEFLAETITCTGCREKLDNAFREAIVRARGTHDLTERITGGSDAAK